MQAGQDATSSSNSSSGPSVTNGASEAAPMTPGLISKLFQAVESLGGPTKATPQAVLEQMGWPGMSEKQVASFLSSQVGVSGWLRLACSEVGCERRTFCCIRRNHLLGSHGNMRQDGLRRVKGW